MPSSAMRLQIVGEELCETVNLCQDQRVLDVAAGNFHASMAAARRWCDVTATDVPSDLTRRSRQRDRGGVRRVYASWTGDAEALPFADQSFDAVLSSFGAMFAQDQERAASEMIRVCRRGRPVGLANWTPEGFVGQLFKVLARFAAAGERRPHFTCDWGNARAPARVVRRLWRRGDAARRTVAFRARTPMDWVDKLRVDLRARVPHLRGAGCRGQARLRTALLDLVTRFNRAKDTSMVVDAQYLEVVVRRR